MVNFEIGNNSKYSLMHKYFNLLCNPYFAFMYMDSLFLQSQQWHSTILFVTCSSLWIVLVLFVPLGIHAWTVLLPLVSIESFQTLLLSFYMQHWLHVWAWPWKHLTRLTMVWLGLIGCFVVYDILVVVHHSHKNKAV